VSRNGGLNGTGASAGAAGRTVFRGKQEHKEPGRPFPAWIRNRRPGSRHRRV